MCSRCSDLEARVDELEQLLEHSIYVTGIEARRVSTNLKVSPDQARILVVLYKARQPLLMREIDEAVPITETMHKNRADPDYRSTATLRQQVFLIRKRLGAGVIENRYAAGSLLTEVGREMVRRALAA